MDLKEDKEKRNEKLKIENGLMIVDIFGHTITYRNSTLNGNDHEFDLLNLDGKYGYSAREQGTIAILCIDYRVKESLNNCIKLIEKLKFTTLNVVVTGCDTSRDLYENEKEIEGNSDDNTKYFCWNDVVTKIGDKYGISCFETGHCNDDDLDNSIFVLSQIVIEYLLYKAN